jgi:hypothetical protein
MLITLEINTENADEFMNLVQSIKDFMRFKKIQLQEMKLDIIPPKIECDVTTLKISEPFLSSEQIDNEIENMRNEWENNIY